MNQTTLTKRGLRKALKDAYAQAVASRPDCEEGFRSLSEAHIKVFIYKKRLKVQFPCLQVQSVAAQCAQQAIQIVRRQLFSNNEYSGMDVTGIISEKSHNPENLRTTSGTLFWVHEFDSEKKA